MVPVIPIRDLCFHRMQDDFVAHNRLKAVWVCNIHAARKFGFYRLHFCSHRWWRRSQSDNSRDNTSLYTTTAVYDLDVGVVVGVLATRIDRVTVATRNYGIQAERDKYARKYNEELHYETITIQVHCLCFSFSSALQRAHPHKGMHFLHRLGWFCLHIS